MKDRFYVAMQAREQTLGSKSDFFLSSTKHRRALAEHFLCRLLCEIMIMVHTYQRKSIQAEIVVVEERIE